MILWSVYQRYGNAIFFLPSHAVNIFAQSSRANAYGERRRRSFKTRLPLFFLSLHLLPAHNTHSFWGIVNTSNPLVRGFIFQSFNDQEVNPKDAAVKAMIKGRGIHKCIIIIIIRVNDSLRNSIKSRVKFDKSSRGVVCLLRVTTFFRRQNYIKFFSSLAFFMKYQSRIKKKKNEVAFWIINEKCHAPRHFLHLKI